MATKVIRIFSVIAVAASLAFLPSTSYCRVAILQVTAGADTIITADYHFGFNDVARDGIDSEDSADPPPSPNDQISIAFRIPTCPPDFPNRWRRDIRGFSSPDYESRIWELHLDSSVTVVELSFDRYEVTPGITFPALRIIDEFVETRVEIPGTYEVSVFDGTKDLFIVFHLDEAVSTERCSWGEIKALYQ